MKTSLPNRYHSVQCDKNGTQLSPLTNLTSAPSYIYIYWLIFAFGVCVCAFFCVRVYVDLQHSFRPRFRSHCRRYHVERRVLTATAIAVPRAAPNVD